MTGVGLPRDYRVLRDRLRTAVNALDTLERLEIAGAWGAEASNKKRHAARKTIDQCITDAVNALGIRPDEQKLLSDVIQRQQDEIKRLTDALHRAVSSPP
jgi:hypothetical protein